MRQGDREVLVDQGGARRITWSTLDKRVDACAVVLRDPGTRRGDAVGLLLHNCAEFVCAHGGPRARRRARCARRGRFRPPPDGPSPDGRRLTAAA
jgi:hypothetical protein